MLAAASGQLPVYARPGEEATTLEQGIRLPPGSKLHRVGVLSDTPHEDKKLKLVISYNGGL